MKIKFLLMGLFAVISLRAQTAENLLYQKNYLQLRNEFAKLLNNYSTLNSKFNQIQSNSVWQQIHLKNSINDENYAGVGRVNVLKSNSINSKTMYLGSASAGIWKSFDGAENWFELKPTNLMSTGISDIAISKSDTNIIYAATGNANGIIGLGENPSFGVIKSIDGGISWKLLSPFALPVSPNDNLYINRIFVDNLEPNKVYLSSNYGVYSTSDGGSNWQQISKDRCSDIILASSTKLIAAFIDKDKKLSLQSYNFNNKNWVNELELGNYSKLRFNTNKIDSNALTYITTYEFKKPEYAGFGDINNFVYVMPFLTSFNYLGNSIKYSDSTTNSNYAMVLCSSSKNKFLIGGGNLWDVFFGSIFTAKTDTFKEDSLNKLPKIHPYIHDILYLDSSNIFLATDGGIYKSEDNLKSFQTKNNGLNLLEVTHLSLSKSDNPKILAGNESNGTNLYENKSWRNLSGFYGFVCEIDFRNENLVYVSKSNGEFYKSTNGGLSIDSIPIIVALNSATKNPKSYNTNENAFLAAPIALDPIDNNNLYIGHQNIWKSIDNGNSFTKLSNFGTDSNSTIRKIALSTSNNNVIYVVTSQNNSLPFTYTKSTIWKTVDAGKNWVNFNKLIGDSYITTEITDLLVDSTNPDKIFCSSSNYINTKKVFKIENNNFLDISYNLPNIPVNTIISTNNANYGLLVGTNLGVYSFNDKTNKWEQIGEKLPQTVINDIVYNKINNTLYCGTYGSGIWTLKLNACNLVKPILSIQNKSIKLCENDSVSLSITNGQDYSLFEWNNGIKTDKLSISKSGTYYCKVFSSDTLCSILSDTIEVTVQTIPLKPTINLVGNELSSSILSNSYQWYLDNSKIDGATTKSIIPQKNGAYKVEIFSENGCKNISDEFVFTDVEDDNQNELLVSYDENNNEVIINLIDSDFHNNKLNMEIISLEGKSIATYNLDAISINSVNKVKLNQISRGIYFLKIVSGTNLNLQKILIGN